MNYIREPELNSKCDITTCGDTFAQHYATFDGKRTGCMADKGQREGRCSCPGFAFIYRPKVKVMTYSNDDMRNTSAESYYNR